MIDFARGEPGPFGHNACARQNAMDRADGLSRVRQTPRMQRDATSVTILRYARPTNVPPPSITATKLMSVGV
ncbi:hypothetical protein IQ26_05464 [Mesorhizobium tianshanense]|uniref:Uncharacterized protein n=1 Tax=Mesorhizobium tianshanense TaxID=39844 RepID=A0A562N730_9HYPH|nr:hypothetical protein IQ26_05464 [Mesorhizobium tianshanense]